MKEHEGEAKNFKGPYNRKGKTDCKKKLALDLSKRRVLTLADIEECYGIASETLKKWIRRNPADGVPPLRAHKPGRDLMVFRDDLENYIRTFPVGA